MRLIHTADWHLGQSLHGIDRIWEHDLFLDWLLEQLEVHRADALVVAGDIFDVAHPSSAALGQYYRFLAEARRRCPNLDMVVVGGNHDSPARLDAPAKVLGALGVRVVGGLPTGDLDSLIVPLTVDSTVAGWLLAVPFLRPRDIPGAGALSTDPSAAGARAHDRLIEGHRMLYRRLIDRVEPHLRLDQPIIATGHCYMAGGAVSALSERKIQVGHQHALPVDVFPPELTYVALGHLHRAQSVGDHAHIRYSGSPLPLSLSERDYAHQVLRIDFDGARIARIEPLFVPRAVEILRVPEAPAPVAEVLEQLRALPRQDPDGADPRRRPYLEVRILLDEAQPRLRQDVQAALEGAWPRLLRIDVQRPERIAAEQSWQPRESLDRLAPTDVFEACYQRTRDREPSEALRARFADLLDTVQREEAS